MPHETIKSILAAEEAARLAKLEAQQNAKIMIEEAEHAGQATVSAAVEQAQQESAHLIRAAEVKAAGDAEELKSNTENRQATMRVRAEGRLDKAAMFIVERIVKD